MRLWVRSGVQIKLSFGLSRAVGSASETSKDKVLYQPINLSPGKLILVKKVVNKIRQRFPKLSSIAEFLYVTVRYQRSGWGTLLPLLFKIRGKACVGGTPLSLRIDQPMSNGCSREALHHFGLQSSHLNSCHYHQDLHQEMLNSNLHQELHSKPHALLPIAASCNNNDLVSATRLSAIHFRGQSIRKVNSYTLLGFQLP